jgi:Helix-loop-helix DNA-binding domain
MVNGGGASVAYKRCGAHCLAPHSLSFCQILPLEEKLLTCKYCTSFSFLSPPHFAQFQASVVWNQKFGGIMKAMTLTECRPVSPRKLVGKCNGIRKWRKSCHQTEDVDTMELLFEKLVQMIPNIPKERKMSRLEILQHVIQYIRHLESQMEFHPDAENLCSGLNCLRISLQSKSTAF